MRISNKIPIYPVMTWRRILQ